MTDWIGWAFPVNLMFAYIVYIYLYNRKKWIGFHLGMNIAMAAGGGMAISTGVIIITLFPLNYLEASVAAILAGSLTGIMYGQLFDYQTLLTGYINGMMMGIMAPMVGASAGSLTMFLIMIEIFVLSCFCLIVWAAYRTG